jgi:hypothetical protein
VSLSALSSRSRRGRLLTALVVAASVVAVPLSTATPAGAAAAPLLTDKGIGVRIDETAVADAYADIEADVLPLVEATLDAGVLDHAGFIPPMVPDWADATFDLDLALDFTAPATGAPNGGLTLSLTVDDLFMRTYRYGEWWQPECHYYVEDFGTLTMDATVHPDPSSPPVTIGSGGEDWSAATPVTSVAPGYSFICYSYLTNGEFDWAGYSDMADPASPAGLVQDLLQTTLVGLADQMWDDNVWPVMSSLTTLAGFDVDIDELRADDHGLVAIADVDATAGVTVAGWGPYPVGSAVDAGVTSNVATLLAQRSLGGVDSDIIVSLHPNVTNQYLTALHDRLNGAFGTTAISSSIAAALVDPTLGTCYNPTGWTTRLEAQAPPHLTPSGAGGAPEMQLPQTTVQFRNAGCNPSDPRVATFTGSLDDIAVTTTGTPLGPRGAAATASWAATRTQADAATAARVPPATAATLLSWAQGALATFLTNHVPGHVDLTVAGFTGHAATHCDTCGRYSGDDRITETFHIS